VPRSVRVTAMKRALFVLGALGALGVAHAQQAGEQPSWASQAVQAPPTVGLPGSGGIPANPYEGVSPGSPNPPPRAAQVRGADRALVTWPGFQMTPGGSRVFVQTSRPVSFNQTGGQNRFVVHLRNCRIHTKNNRNPLVTRHFNTPVARAFLVARRRDVELVVELRSGVTPTVRQETGSDGFQFLFLDFPEGAFLPADPDSVPVPSWQPSSAPSSPEGSEESPPETIDEGAGPTQ